MFFQTSRRCYCAFCKSERLVYSKKHVSVIDIGLAALAGLLLSVIVWQDFDPRAVVFFSLGLGLAELFIQVRWRLSIPCPHCGFDPVLYKRSPPLAAERVKVHMARRRESPAALFTPAPKIPVIVKKASHAAGNGKPSSQSGAVGLESSH